MMENWEDEELFPEEIPLWEPDPKNMYLPDFGEEEAEAQRQEDALTQQERTQWQTYKEALNRLGLEFSQSEPSRRFIPIEKILNIFEKILVRFDDDNISDREYEKIIRSYNSKYKDRQSQPVRFLKEIYPEDLFYNAVFKTLGCYQGERGLSKCAYDHTKGASYVTYFNNILRYTVLDGMRKNYREKEKEEKKLADYALEQEVGTKANDHSLPYLPTDSLVCLAELTTTALHCGKKLLGTKAADRSRIKPATLQLFYSFYLVNSSRFAGMVSERENRYLMSAADMDFLAFSTTLEESCTDFDALTEAALSEYVMTNRLYEELHGLLLLQQKVAAIYQNVGEGNISDKFTNVKHYLFTAITC